MSEKLMKRANDPDIALDTTRPARPMHTLKLSFLTDQWKREAAKGSEIQKEALREYRKLGVVQQDITMLSILKLKYPHMKLMMRPKYMEVKGPAFDPTKDVRELMPVPVAPVVLTSPHVIELPYTHPSHVESTS